MISHSRIFRGKSNKMNLTEEWRCDVFWSLSLIQLQNVILLGNFLLLAQYLFRFILQTRKKTISLAALTNLTKKPTSANFRLTKHEQSKLIDQMLLSGDESTLLCSFYGRHVAVFDMKTLSHKHTLTNKHSMLLLHQVTS